MIRSFLYLFKAGQYSSFDFYNVYNIDNTYMYNIMCYINIGIEFILTISISYYCVLYLQKWLYGISENTVLIITIII